MEAKVVAMLLAGGQGSRLKTLTQNIAKPAVAFGGKYRIIDFALSNSTNSGIANIGILTQYKPYLLNTHIGIGSAWDFDRNFGGLRVLPPFTSETGGRWYTGTANAIYENIDYLDEQNPDYVLILSGDHIYKMDYSQLLDFHKENEADCSIATLEVPWDEASRFGIINTGDDNIIVEFDEKPENPKNNMASMGIYMFDWKKLRQYLIADANDRDSDHDFGKNVLPRMLNEGNKMYAYPFKGYWKDVGTVRSYWEANMDLLDENNTLDLYNKDWRIYTNNRNLPPHYIGRDSEVVNSLVNEGCIIKGNVKNSVLFSGVSIEDGAEVNNSVILSNCQIKSGAKLNNVILVEGITIENDEKIGDLDDESIYLVSADEILVE